MPVATDTRAAALATFRARRDVCRALGCNYWVFERLDISGAFTEFFEAGDEQLLARAREAAGVAGDGSPIHREVEL